MKTFLQFLRTTITGGILFLLPVVLLTIILGKAYHILIRFSAPLARRMPELILGLDGSNLLAIVLIIVICFFGGLLFRSARVRKSIRGLEDTVLAYVPGYFLLKSIAADAVGNTDHDMNSILVKDGEAWSIAFLVEEGVQFCTVYIPDAPRHDSGEVKIVPTEWVKKINIGSNKLALSLKHFGKGALAHLEQP